MRITVRLFASLRDLVGQHELRLEFSHLPVTVADVVHFLGVEFPKTSSMLGRCATAVNTQYVSREHALADGDELALIPPVSGGRR